MTAGSPGSLTLLVMVSSFSGAPSVVAAERTGPVITSHRAGEQVSGQIEVTVSSTAPYVLVAWGPEADSAWVSAIQTQDGVATATLTSSGYVGPTEIVAQECQSPCAGDWGSTSPPAETSVLVEVSNPAPEWNLNAWVSEFHGDGTLWGVDEGPWAWYGFFIDGEYVPPVDDTAFVGFEASRLGDGSHTAQMAHCTEHSHRIIEPVVCDMTHASQTRSFTIRTALHPTITRLRPRIISPDDNGIADVASVTMTAVTRQLVS